MFVVGSWVALYVSGEKKSSRNDHRRVISRCRKNCFCVCCERDLWYCPGDRSHSRELVPREGQGMVVAVWPPSLLPLGGRSSSPAASGGGSTT